MFWKFQRIPGAEACDDACFPDGISTSEVGRVSRSAEYTVSFTPTCFAQTVAKNRWEGANASDVIGSTNHCSEHCCSRVTGENRRLVTQIAGQEM